MSRVSELPVVKLTPEQVERWVARHFDYNKRRGGAELTLCNPFVKGDDKQKFNITLQERVNKHGRLVAVGSCHDWRYSQFNFGFIKFIQKFKNLTYTQAIRDIVGDGFDIRTIRDQFKAATAEPVKVQHIALPAGAIPITEKTYPTAQRMAFNYLKSRCLTDEDLEIYNIHYTMSSIVFPYFEFDELCFWQSREIGRKIFMFPDSVKHGVGKTDFLFGFDQAMGSEEVFVVEANFGATSIGPGALGSGGAVLVERQRRKLSFIKPKRVIFCPDLDHAGILSLIENYRVVSPYHETWYCLPPANIQLPNGDTLKDWNEYDQLKGGHVNGYPCHDYIMAHAHPITIRTLVMLRRLANLLKGKN